jgi:hypothetical protein
MADSTSSSTPATTQVTTAARLAILTVVAFEVIAAALILVRHDLDPAWQTTSIYARGRLGWIMSVGFLLSAVSYGATIYAVRRWVHGWYGRLGLVILALCTVAMALTGVFTSDPIETLPANLSTVGKLHAINAFFSLMFIPFAAALINMALARRDQAWVGWKRSLIVSGFLPLEGLVIFWIWNAAVAPSDWHFGPGINVGWPGRFLLLVHMVWVITLASQVLQMQRRGISLSAQAVG